MNYEELRRLAVEAKGWNITAIKSATDEDPCRLGTLDEDTDEFCELITIDCENYYKSSLPLAAYIAAASPDVVLAMLDEIVRKDEVIDQRNAEISRIKSSTITHDEWYAQCNDITRKDALLLEASEALKDAFYALNETPRGKETHTVMKYADAAIAAIEKELTP